MSDMSEITTGEALDSPFNRSPFMKETPASERIIELASHVDELDKDLDEALSDSILKLINDNFSVTYIFNKHGDNVDAFRTLSAMGTQQPFITFIESTDNDDPHQAAHFIESLDNAFAMEFEAAQPRDANSEGPADRRWHYWRNRGLLEKGSLIIPVDLRRYSMRRMNAFLDVDYGERFISGAPDTDFMLARDLDTMLEIAREHGMMVMYTNAIRERVASLQMVQALAAVVTDDYDTMQLREEQARKMTALCNSRKNKAGEKLPVFVVYGASHHLLPEILRRRGLAIDRVFANERIPGLPAYSSLFNVDRFFNGHHFGMSEADIEAASKSLLLEFIFYRPGHEPVPYGYVPQGHNIESDRLTGHKIARLARQPKVHEQLPEIYERFKNNPLSVYDILAEHGIWLNRFSDFSLDR